jgi:uncharacterized protein YjbI with pentapeptide repeats
MLQLEQARESQERIQRLTERGQITDRFTRAIDQLGKTNDKGNKVLEIRLGGIYALERIARESEEDHWTIMDILAAYVRQNAPWLPGAGPAREEDSMVTDLQRVSERLSEMSETQPSAPDSEIQAIITILRRRKRFYGHGEPEPLYLSKTNLSGVDLSGANLSGANLSGANLSGANLAEASLSGANLYKVDLFSANLSGVDLSGANLSGANLAGANLSGANVAGADLSDAVLFLAHLPGVDLSAADLSAANFSWANLAGANLSGANPTDMTLSGANLSGTQHLTQEQLEQAHGDEETQLPPRLKPPAHWA